GGAQPVRLPAAASYHRGREAGPGARRRQRRGRAGRRRGHPRRAAASDLHPLPTGPADARADGAHPADPPPLPMPARMALTLRTLCGLTAAEIARAFLVTEPTMEKRLVRARAKI